MNKQETNDLIKDLNTLNKRLVIIGGKSLVMNGSELTEEISSIGFDLDRLIEYLET